MNLLFKRSTIHPIVLVIIGLAGIGLLYRLIANPLGLFKEIFIAVVIVGIIFAVYKYVMQKRVGGNSQANAKYRKAVQQSKKRLYSETSNHLTSKVRGSSQKHPNSKKPMRTLHTARRKDHNFTVIEGNKGKKKNRAHF
ncbi:SA1362 family protein [Schinkia azotoformans]|uniref:SA1362 family protein n=1 Tax=Schinkia azotoformans TaxID=1454 RepID=UPI001E29E606|nr:SA1362 family protein [Schinkia azotoformans]MEC1694642.1 SA1362 family protein [Schinkia azotoformans]MEC1718404.1 SA1362 family protein [Schinkia azotoformans]MEC1725703.1 SA1362 family protein [Schinkia azotoformans]MEC1759712.1 SA1362 family protein [Schinkia azotoformans]MEC1766746.1 SA1362 family protein [Schinkia azotoformans]